MSEPAGTERGLSEAIGTIVLIAIVALGIGTAGVAILSTPPPQKIPALNAEVTSAGDAVFLRHTGGDTLAWGSFRILVDGTDRTGAFRIGGAVPARWAVGDTLRYDRNGAPLPSVIQVTSVSGGSEQVVLRLRIDPAAPVTIFTPYPTVTFTPTPTESPVYPPVTDFTGYPLSGNAPLMVQFADTSTNSPVSWSWSFGDGSTSILQNPAHSYFSAGNYTVSLTAANAAGSNTSTKTAYIRAYALLAAGFTWRGLGSTNVQFTETSTGGATTWNWLFGDGGIASGQKVNHKYSRTGQYHVTLTVTRSGDGATSTVSQVVTVT